MAYKNSNTNSSIKEEWGQWRYFNSALKKLDVASPSTIALSAPTPAAEKQADWMSAVGDVLNGVMGAFEARRDLSYQKADEYLKTHSLEEYKQAIQKGNVPFQNDPIAMQRLMYDHGKLLFAMSEEDFAQRVANGEFVGKEPEEVDAAHYEHSKKAMKEVAGIFGYNVNDPWFKEGFYVDSEKGRAKSLVDNSAVTSERLWQEREVQDMALITAEINNGTLTAERVNEIINGGGRAYSPEQAKKLVDGIIATLAESPNGAAILSKLKDAKLPFGKGVTWGSYVGDYKIKEAMTKSQNLRDIESTKDYIKFRLEVDELADNGDVAGIDKLLGPALNNEDRPPTQKELYLMKQRMRALEVQKRAFEKAAKKKVDTKSSAEVREFFVNIGKGKENTISYAKLQQNTRENGYSANDEEVDIQETFQGFMNVGDTEAVGNLMSYAANKSDVHPKAKSFFQDMIADAKDSINNIMEEGLRNGGVVDKKLHSYGTYQIRLRGEKEYTTVEDIPKDMYVLLTLYYSNPSAAARLYKDDGEAMDIARQATLAIKSGKPVMPFLMNKKALARDYVKENRRNPYAPELWETLKPDGAKFLAAESTRSEALSRVSQDQFGLHVMNQAQVLLKNDPTMSTTKAIKDAKEIVYLENYKVGPMIVPQTVADDAFQGLDAKPSEVGEALNSIYREDIRKLQLKPDEALTVYDDSGQRVLYVNLNGDILKEVPMETFMKRAAKRCKAQREEAARTVMGEGAYTPIVGGNPVDFTGMLQDDDPLNQMGLSF